MRKGKSLLIFGHVDQGQRLRLLKNEISFPQRNSRRYYAINSQHGMSPAH